MLRSHHDAFAPESHFRRQYRALQSLPATLAPRPLGYYAGWMAVEYVEGSALVDLPETGRMASLLHHLHQQRRFGWRVNVLRLLEHYWQFSDPARRFPAWLRLIKRLQRHGEPRPLRLAPLHMDVHSGNIIDTAHGLQLIDWEYAGDGDIALELAAIGIEGEPRQALLAAYAHRAGIAPAVLQKQVRRWRIWVGMLMAGWYEYRWRQTGEQQFIALADASWRQLTIKK